MADLDAVLTNKKRFLHIIYPARVPRVILSEMAPDQTCPNHRHILLLLESFK